MLDALCVSDKLLCPRLLVSSKVVERFWKSYVLPSYGIQRIEIDSELKQYTVGLVLYCFVLNCGMNGCFRPVLVVRT